MTNNNTVNFNDLIGKPFSEDGYGPDSYSCYGLTVEVLHRYGVTIPKTNISVCACKAITEAEINKHVARYWKPITYSEIDNNIPCVCLIQAHPGYAQHVGVYIGNGLMIHTSMSKNTCIEKFRNWKNKVNGYYVFNNKR